VPLVTEDLAPVEPDVYGRSKAECERLLAAAVDGGLRSGLAIRLPGTVGRGSHDNFLSGALAAALQGDTVTVRHPDALFNNIVFVGDLARFLWTWAEASRPGYHVTNLAARDPVALRTVSATLFECLALPPRVAYVTSGKQPFLISIDRALSLGYDAPTVMNSLTAFVADATGSPCVR
jgi:nucleoside-diphosphate-sugar epimerase